MKNPIPISADAAKVLRRDPAWRKDLLSRHTAGGSQPIPCLENAITVLRRADEFRDALVFNEFSLKTSLVRTPPWGAPAPRDVTDIDDRQFAAWCQRNAGLLITTGTAGEAIEVVSRDCSLHPVRNYLQSLKWDGKSRVSTWLQRYLGVADGSYASVVGKLWLISAVARVRKPGCKVDHVLILEGKQGIGKSTAASILGGSWHTDELSDFGSKDASMQLAGAWIIELGELDTFSRADVSRTKAFVSRQADRFRPPYGKRVIDAPRQCVFLGTTNGTEYLRDETGARRFWPVLCRLVDLDALKKDRDQLWAEAVHLFDAGEPWWLSSSDEGKDAGVHQKIAEEQAARYQGDPWLPVLERHLEFGLPTTINKLLTDVLELPKKNQTQVEANRIARCLTHLKWKRVRRWIDGKKTWCYVPQHTAETSEEHEKTGTTDELGPDWDQWK